MAKRKIIFRADGGPTIGMGHFIRTLALAEMLKDEFYCIFATQSPSEYQKNEIRGICRERIDLPSNETHFEVFIGQLKGDEIVVLDNYYFTTEYQQQIKKKGCQLVCIDDLHNQHFVADIVINHAPEANVKSYSTEVYTKLLLGFDFALLRNEFVNITFQETKKEYALLIMMGGTDPLNLTSAIISKIKDFRWKLPVAVIYRGGH